MDIGTLCSVGTGVAVLTLTRLWAQAEPHRQIRRRLEARQRQDATVEFTWDEADARPFAPQSAQPAA